MVYDQFPKVLSKNEYKIVVEFDGNKIPIYDGDEIYMLFDTFSGDPNNYRRPDISPITFDELYQFIFGNDTDDEPYHFGCELGVCGISVIH